MHRHIAVLFREALVFAVWTWVAFDSEAGTVDIMLLWSFVRDIIEMNWFSRNWDLSNNSSKLLIIQSQHFRYGRR